MAKHSSLSVRSICNEEKSLIISTTPGLASPEVLAQEVAVAGVGEVADEDGGNAVGDLTGEQDHSGVRVVEL
jgi:hypothetical protein